MRKAPLHDDFDCLKVPLYPAVLITSAGVVSVTCPCDEHVGNWRKAFSP